MRRAVLIQLLFPVVFVGCSYIYSKAPNLKTGEHLYMETCQTCHRDARQFASISPEMLLLTINNGTAKMHSFKEDLTEAEKRKIIRYIRSF